MAENSSNLWKDLNIQVHEANNFPPNLKPKRSSIRHIIIKMYWVVMPSSRGIFPSQDQTQISCIAGGFFTVVAEGLLFVIQWTHTENSSDGVQPAAGLVQRHR